MDQHHASERPDATVRHRARNAFATLIVVGLMSAFLVVLGRRLSIDAVFASFMTTGNCLCGPFAGGSVPSSLLGFSAAGWIALMCWTLLVVLTPIGGGRRLWYALGTGAWLMIGFMALVRGVWRD